MRNVMIAANAASCGENMENKPQNIYIADRKRLRALWAIVFLAIYCAIIAAYILVFCFLPKVQLTEGGTISMTEIYIILAAAFIIFTVAFLAPSVAYFNKLRYVYTFWADEEGVHDYYHVLRTGTIYWQEIDDIYLHKFNLLDTPPDSCILLQLKDAKQFKAGRPFFWKIMRGSAVALPFNMARGSRRDIYAGLSALYEYYKTDGGYENG